MSKDKRIPHLRVPLPKQTEKVLPDETKYNRKKEKAREQIEIDAEKLSTRKH